MQLVRFDHGEPFWRRTQAFLQAREAENNLVLGLAAQLRSHVEAHERPYLAAVVGRGGVICAAVRTPPRDVVLSETERPDALDLVADDLWAAGEDPPGVVGPSAVVRRFAARWRARGGQEAEVVREERIYRLVEVCAVPRTPRGRRRAEGRDRELLVAWLAAFYLETGLCGDRDDAHDEARRVVDRRLCCPDAGFFLWEDGAPVALAGYSGPTGTGIRVNSVYTPPPLRRRGYAGALVAELSRMLLAEGYRQCFLFTDLANHGANRLYPKIGYAPVSDVHQLRFVGPRVGHGRIG